MDISIIEAHRRKSAAADLRRVMRSLFRFKSKEVSAMNKAEKIYKEIFRLPSL